MPTIPPWLQTSPRDFVQAAERGRSLGQSAKSEKDQVALANARMAQQAQGEQQQMALAMQQLQQREKMGAMEMQARKEQEERNFLISQQRNQIQDAYHQASIGLQKRRVEDVAQQSARKYAPQQKLSALTSAGVPFDKAILQVPELMEAGAVSALTRSSTAKPGGVEKMSDIDKVKYNQAVKEITAGEKELQGLGWFGSKKGPTERIQNAKQVMQEIEQKYKTSAGTGQSSGVTHVFNPKTGKIEPMGTQSATEQPTEQPTAEPQFPMGNTYGGMTAKDHFEEVRQ